jgi:CRP-like cAMP-binding protein
MNLENLAKGMEIRNLTKNQVVFEEKAFGNQEMFFIFSGDVCISRSLSGIDEEINHLKAGSFFGEIALIQNVPRTASATVVSDTAKIGVISRNQFIVLSKTNPEFLVVLFKKLQERILVRTENRDLLHIQEQELNAALSSDIWIKIKEEAKEITLEESTEDSNSESSELSSEQG